MPVNQAHCASAACVFVLARRPMSLSDRGRVPPEHYYKGCATWPSRRPTRRTAPAPHACLCWRAISATYLLPGCVTACALSLMAA